LWKTFSSNIYVLAPKSSQYSLLEPCQRECGAMSPHLWFPLSVPSLSMQPLFTNCAHSQTKVRVNIARILCIGLEKTMKVKTHRDTPERESCDFFGRSGAVLQMNLFGLRGITAVTDGGRTTPRLLNVQTIMAWVYSRRLLLFIKNTMECFARLRYLFAKMLVMNFFKILHHASSRNVLHS